MSAHSIELGILGAGFMARTYAEVLARYASGGALVGITGGTRAAHLAADYGAHHFSSYDELLAAPGLRAVLITTPQAAHAGQALTALRAGKHIMLEKPMAVTAEECDAICAEAARTGLQVGIGFTQRSRICNIQARALLASGELGRVRLIRSWQRVPGGAASLPKWHYLSENQGTLLGYGVHNIDLIRWLSGQEIDSVAAVCLPSPQHGLEATSSLLLRLADGTTAQVHCTFDDPKPGFPQSMFGAWIACDSGLLDLDSYGALRISRAGGAWETLVTQAPIDWAGKGMLDPVRLESYTAHLNDFIAAVAENRPPAITGWDGRQAVAVSQAAYTSSASGKTLHLECTTKG